MRITQITIVYTHVPFILVDYDQVINPAGIGQRQIAFNELGNYVALLTAQQAALGLYVNFNKSTYRLRNKVFDCIQVIASETPQSSAGVGTPSIKIQSDIAFAIRDNGTPEKFYSIAPATISLWNYIPIISEFKLMMNQSYLFALNIKMYDASDTLVSSYYAPGTDLLIEVPENVVKITCMSVTMKGTNASGSKWFISPDAGIQYNSIDDTITDVRIKGTKVEVDGTVRSYIANTAVLPKPVSFYKQGVLINTVNQTTQSQFITPTTYDWDAIVLGAGTPPPPPVDPTGTLTVEAGLGSNPFLSITRVYFPDNAGLAYPIQNASDSTTWQGNTANFVIETPVDQNGTFNIYYDGVLKHSRAYTGDTPFTVSDMPQAPDGTTIRIEFI